jgi:hypothetical protein
MAPLSGIKASIKLYVTSVAHLPEEAHLLNTGSIKYDE